MVRGFEGQVAAKGRSLGASLPCREDCDYTGSQKGSLQPQHGDIQVRSEARLRRPSRNHKHHPGERHWEPGLGQGRRGGSPVGWSAACTKLGKGDPGMLAWANRADSGTTEHNELTGDHLFCPVGFKVPLDPQERSPGQWKYGFIAWESSLD